MPFLKILITKNMSLSAGQKREGEVDCPFFGPITFGHVPFANFLLYVSLALKQLPTLLPSREPSHRRIGGRQFRLGTVSAINYLTRPHAITSRDNIAGTWVLSITPVRI